MVVVVSLIRDVVATLTHDKMNTKGGQRAFYHKSLERHKTLNLTLEIKRHKFCGPKVVS